MKIPEPDLTLLIESKMMEGLEILPGGHCSRVYACDERVLKVPFQGEELNSGWKATLELAGNGSGLEVLDFRQDSGAVWMRRIRPGTPLAYSDLSFDEMREIYVDLFLAVRGRKTDSCLPLAGYFETPDKLARVAEMERTAPVRGFLHGDLHHENILDGGQKWVVIDPKGLEGDIHYELIAWLRNPAERLRQIDDLAAHLGNEIEKLCSRLSLDPVRVVKWGILDSDGHEDPNHPWTRLPSAYKELEKRF